MGKFLMLLASTCFLMELAQAKEQLTAQTFSLVDDTVLPGTASIYREELDKNQGWKDMEPEMGFWSYTIITISFIIVIAAFGIGGATGRPEVCCAIYFGGACACGCCLGILTLLASFVVCAEYSEDNPGVWEEMCCYCDKITLGQVLSRYFLNFAILFGSKGLLNFELELHFFSSEGDLLGNYLTEDFLGIDMAVTVDVDDEWLSNSVGASAGPVDVLYEVVGVEFIDVSGHQKVQLAYKSLDAPSWLAAAFADGAVSAADFSSELVKAITSQDVKDQFAYNVELRTGQVLTATIDNVITEVQKGLYIDQNGNTIEPEDTDY